MTCLSNVLTVIKISDEIIIGLFIKILLPEIFINRKYYFIIYYSTFAFVKTFINTTVSFSMLIKMFLSRVEEIFLNSN